MSDETLDQCFAQLQHRVAMWGKRLRLPLDAVTEVEGILSNAFGVEWLGSQIPKMAKPGGFFPARRHPLADALASATPSHLVMMFELAAYLKNLARVPRFPLCQ